MLSIQALHTGSAELAVFGGILRHPDVVAQSLVLGSRDCTRGISPKATLLHKQDHFQYNLRAGMHARVSRQACSHPKTLHFGLQKLRTRQHRAMDHAQ